nr:laminin subunit beta-1 isoform X2 [Leptinotarsa decemlineata]
MVNFTIGLWLLIVGILIKTMHLNGQYIGARQRTFNHVPKKAQFLQRGDQSPPSDADPYLDNRILQEIHPLADANKFRRQGFEPKKLHPCEQSSCYPATGNLLIGRESQLYASSTCGTHGQQRYCIVSHLDAERKKCFWCDSRPTTKPNPLLNHNISNIVYRLFPGTRQKSWWQSENGKEKVYIQLDLEAEFHFTHLIITFKTFRPAAMLIERSYDFKQTWQVYRYFAHNCNESFPGIREGTAKNLTDIVCESRYSGVAPSTDGEIIYRVLPPNLPIDNPYSEQVQGLLKITNLRINFTKLHTLGDDLLDRREEIQEKYYYAITDMVVRGSCSCYGHANRCLPLPGIDPKPDMVHGRCECTHNTKGRNCEKCEDFFNDLPWRPAIGKQTNACKRCNCNNHATSCHFDSALYEATGRVSGGVCDGCQHNTMGPNCEQCKPFFYNDPKRDIQDPEVCRPCDCDPSGSLDGGICDSVSDPVNNLVAGSCHCKTNVEGRRCDYCKNGYWNFTEENPDGCEKCTCHTLGTIDNQGCHVDTGECFCKRYVTGRDCDQCFPQFWDLSDRKDGCQPCDCDPGGSHDNFCDVNTGQCRCRDHMSGRTCNIPEQQYFTANLNFLLYEAEAAKSSGQVVIREPFRDGRDDTWTGMGFVKSFEGGFLEFLVNEIKTTMHYDIVIRYEPTTPNSWEEVEVTIERPDGVLEGLCSKMNPTDDIKTVGLPSNARSVTVYPPACFEAGKTYKVKLEFIRSDYQHIPSASVLIDSIVLIPRVEDVPFFQGSAAANFRRQEYERYHCSNPSYFTKGAEVPEICSKYYASIGAYVFNGAFSCQCDPTGSVSKLCESNGGYCMCKPFVVGRRCDRCAPGTYDFGPEGCRSCDCNSIGALDNFCNATTGQCKCRTNTYGRECDQCRTGFWNFPNCERCDCNGHADVCEAKTGVCINCRDNTQGEHCDYCMDSFYGDPRIKVDIPCRPCPCPGLVGSNHSYADICMLDPSSKDVNCECQEGYSGARCDVCSDNYYGNPEVPGGKCQPCDCNDKVDLLSPGNCDPHTGKCLKCLYDTIGDHCEVCKPGFFRYSEDRQCEECVCHILGTNSSAGPCDHASGQCHCLPNVSGLKCDACVPNHWKIASGKGCEPCTCDPLGSLSPQCNEFDGQCQCRPGFGGRKCDECMPKFFGDPKVQCSRCECDQLGARTEQCNMQTGACVCLPGVGGYKCDRCDRGYIGDVPECIPCGECFDNWDRILQETKNQTLDMIERADDIKKVGATGAYTKEFDEMQNKLDEIEKLLNNTDEIDLGDIEDELQKLRDRISKTENDKLNKLDGELDDNKQLILIKELKLQTLNTSLGNLKEKIKELENNGTKLQEANVQGALTLIGNAKEKADEAVQKAEHSQKDVKYAEIQCIATSTFINNTEKLYKKQSADNENELRNISAKLEALNKQIPELNNLVCDGHGDPCDSICGGAGCGYCGDILSCANGAKQQANTAIEHANNTETALRNKETLANDFIRNVSQINTNQTRNLAKETYDKIFDELKKANMSLKEVTDMRKEMREFMGQNNTKPSDIKKLAEEILMKNVQKTPEEVRELALNIKNAVDRLTNTDYIIDATKGDLARVNELKEHAKYAKSNATKLLKEAEDVNDSLNQTRDAQVEAEEAIEKAWDDYRTVEDILYQIGNNTETAQNTTQDIHNHIHTLKNKLTDLQRNITDNGIFANRVIEESENIVKSAQKTKDDSLELQNKYNAATGELEQKLNNVKATKERANDLFTKALNLVARVTKTQEDIQKLEDSGQGEELKNLENLLQDLIKKMNKYTSQLDNKVLFYKNCN